MLISVNLLSETHDIRPVFRWYPRHHAAPYFFFFFFPYFCLADSRTYLNTFMVHSTSKVGRGNIRVNLVEISFTCVDLTQAS